MLIVVASYRQNVHAYPSGGGDYEVATTNLGVPGRADRRQRAARRLRADRRRVGVVRRAVRGGGDPAAARARGARSRWPSSLVLMTMNLRGVRESGTAFAIPTYVFMAAILGMGLSASSGYALGDLPHGRERRPEIAPAVAVRVTGLGGLGWGFLLLRAFSSGCAALTGVEAISNGVPAFKEPKSRNAATTLALLGGIAVDDAHEHHRAGQQDGPALRRGPGDPAAARRQPGRAATTSRTRSSARSPRRCSAASRSASTWSPRRPG